MNYRMIRNILGWLLLFEAVFLLVPIVTALVYRESVVFSYLWAAGACVFVGALFRLGKPKSTQLYSRDGFVIVALSWILLSLFGALPLWLTREIPSYIDAFFEAVSGFTTTGASVITDLSKISHASLLWRSFTHWIGGMGVLVFIMAFLPLSGGQNMHIMKAESPGPSVSKLVPRVRTTALILYIIYFALTVIMFLTLVLCGMTAFEAINTSFATAGTGGFGFFNDSFMSFPAHIQWIVAVFMVLFSINFASYFLIICRKWKDAFNSEVRTFLGIVLVATALITVNIASLYQTIGEAARHSFFSVATVISTTGFASANFDLWPSFSKFILLVLMFVGACAGSTGGGMKVSRWIILIKGVCREFRLSLHPKQIKKIKMDGKTIEETTVHSVFIYTVSLIGVYLISVLVISLDGFDFATNFSAVAATLNNIGPGFSAVGPVENYAKFTSFSKLVLSFDMLAGRLELYPMLLLFHPATWRRT